MDEILANVQEMIMKDIIQENEENIGNHEKDIEKTKNALEKQNKTRNEIQKLSDDLNESETKKLKKRFNHSLNKTKKANKSVIELYEKKYVMIPRDSNNANLKRVFLRPV